MCVLFQQFCKHIYLGNLHTVSFLQQYFNIVTGRESVHSKNILKYQKNVLSYKYHFDTGINDILWAQYTLLDPNLADLLFPYIMEEKN